MSCSSALHRLNELLDHKTEALRLRTADAGHADNVEAVKIEIGRVKALHWPLPRSKTRSPGTRTPSNGRGRGAMRPGIRPGTRAAEPWGGPAAVSSPW